MAEREDFRPRKVSAPYGHIWKHDGVGGRWWREGVVYTEAGIVSVYQQEGFTAVRIVVDGYIHERVIRGTTHTERGAKAIATRFAREIAG